MANSTMRERMLALVQGRRHDRVPFVQYTNLAAPNEEIWGVIGRENMGLLQWTSVHAIDTPHCSFTQEKITLDGRPGHRRTLQTPEGSLTEERLYEPVFSTTAAATHFIKDPGDYRILLAYLRDVRVRKDIDPFYDTLRAVAGDGLPHTAVPRTPYQQLWVEWVGIQDLAGHFAESPAVMEEVIAEMTAVQRRVFEVVCGAVREAPIPYVNIGDNITAPMIGEAGFRHFCLPAYIELASMLEETGRDVPLFVHMDGDLRALWPAIAESRIRGIDSLSPPPDNDTSVSDALRLWPEMRVCINFPSSLHLAPPERIYEHARTILDEGGHSGRLQIQISENVPPGVWQKSFPQIIRAIADFGPVYI